MIERGRAFLQHLRGLARRTPWDERQCPTCQGHDTWKHGSYQRRPWATPPPRAAGCRLGASTVHFWLDIAGRRAEQATRRGWADVPSSGHLGTDGLWAKLGGKTKAVVLLLADRVTGLVYPPVVTA